LGDKNKQVVSFQALDFLVRDWQNFQNDENIKLCLEEMPEALQFAMQKKTDDLGKNVHDRRFLSLPGTLCPVNNNE